MATLAELRSRLRFLLNDNAADGYLWSDAALDLYLNDALRDYSRTLPRRGETMVTIVAGQSEYALPEDCLLVTRVEVAGAAEEGADGPGYLFLEGKLVLRPTPTASLSLVVRYLTPHTTLVADGDRSTVPAADEDLLLAFAGAEALEGLSTEEAKRQRPEGREGRSAQNAAAILRRRYERDIRVRAAGIRAGRLSVS